MEFALAAIALGFLGSFHCIGMCGPIALALPIGQKSPVAKIFSILSYNFGRVATYALFGAFAGLIGQGFAFGGYQQTVSISLGLIILLFLLLPGKYKSGSLEGKLFRFFNTVKTEIAKLFSKEGKKALFLIGLLNGILPCGLVYAAVAGAIATGDAGKGSLFMAVFGLGTIPAMLSLSLFKEAISIKTRNTMRKAVPVFVGIMATLLIVRGLNLGIPYLSPKPETGLSCHTSQTAGPQKIIKCTKPEHK